MSILNSPRSHNACNSNAKLHPATRPGKHSPRTTHGSTATWAQRLAAPGKQLQLLSMGQHETSNTPRRKHQPTYSHEKTEADTSTAAGFGQEFLSCNNWELFWFDFGGVFLENAFVYVPKRNNLTLTSTTQFSGVWTSNSCSWVLKPILVRQNVWINTVNLSFSR